MHNLYARNVSSEHPVSIWDLDSGADYISLISEADRDLTGWTTENCTITEYTALIKDKVFTESFTSQVVPDDDEVTTSKLTSPDIWSDTNIYLDKPTAASFFIHLNDASIEYIDFGSTNGTLESYTRNYLPTTVEDAWVKISTSDIIYSKLFIRIKFNSGQSAEALTWHINGLTLGQYSEATSSKSLGIEPTNPAGTEDVIVGGALPNSAAVMWYEVPSAEGKSSYHVVRDNRLLAANSGMPMVYGATSTLRLLPIDSPNEGDHPSIVFDGCGVLNELGRYDTYTVEFWLRVSGATTESKKIFGPVGSSDGLYINSSILTLVVGGNIAAHSVGQMYYPMLVHLRISDGFVGLVIDGDEVGGVAFNANDINLPPITENWLGFWSYADLAPIEISSFSIFGYLVPTVVAKRRFVWGQGVSDVGVVNSLQNGTTIFSDFSTSRAANNISYPDNASWQQGNYHNLSIGNNKIGVPDLPLPETVFYAKTKKQWYDDLADVQGAERFFTFRPNVDWNGERMFVRFNNLDQYVKALSGLVVNWAAATPDEGSLTYQDFDTLFDGETYADVPLTYGTYGDIPVGEAMQTIFFIRQKTRPTRMIQMHTDLVNVYVDFFDGETMVRLLNEPINLDTQYVTYLNFQGVINKTNDELAPAALKEMLFNTDDLEIVLGTDGIHTFAGKLYDFSLIDITRKSVIDNLFDAQYFVDHSEYSETFVQTRLCSYTWMPKLEYGHFYEDIGIRGLWEDYIPISSMAAAVQDERGNRTLGLDAIQFNIGHVRPVAKITDAPVWTYDQLKDFYAGKIYTYLYHGVESGYETYSDLSSRASDFSSASFDTTGMFIRSYIAWQKTSRPIKSFANLVALNNIILPDGEDVIYTQALENYIDVPIEIVDGTTIVAPKNRRPDQMALGVYIEFTVPGIKTYPVALKSLEFACFASNRNSFTPVGTKYGKEIYPFNNNGVYYDKMANNPFRIDKRGYPYLYLGRETGFIPDGVRQRGWDRGFQVPIPEGLSEDYRIDSLQLWVRNNRPAPDLSTKMFELIFSNKKIKFYMQAFHGDASRGVITVLDENDLPYSGITMFQNGSLVTNPIINKDEWTALQFSFEVGGLSLGGTTGRFNVYPGLVYNNISYFTPKNYLGATRVVYRKWSDVDDFLWSDWTDDMWSEVLLLGSVLSKTRELSEIVYNTYVGQSTILVDGPEALRLSQGDIVVHGDTRWSTHTLIPS